MTIAAVPLANRWVALEPLAIGHTAKLEEAAAEPEELFRWLPWWMPRTGELTAGRGDTAGTAGMEVAGTGGKGRMAGMAGVVADFLRQAEAGLVATWAIRRQADGRLVGSTSYLDIDPGNRRVEVGATWIGKRWQRTEVNTAAKLLVLSHAFDTLGLERVALKTDHLNVRSQRAIERLGAVREGVLRHHVLRPDGTWRDTVYYSILAGEWPAVLERLDPDRVGEREGTRHRLRRS